MEDFGSSNINREKAYLYDLYTVPGWKEPFDSLIESQLEYPKAGRILEVGCGTGGFAIELASRLGEGVEVVAVDEDAERIGLARGKASVQKLGNVDFGVGTFEEPVQVGQTFDLIVVDLSLIRPSDLDDRLSDIFASTRDLLSEDGQIAFKLATRGSFDEFHSFYWQTLLELDLLEYSSALEGVISERVTVEDLEKLARSAGFRKIATTTQKHEFTFESGESFIQDPLISNEFLPGWTSILGTEEEIGLFKSKVSELIDREDAGVPFDLSAKLTVLTARK